MRLMFQAKIGSKWDEEKNERLKSGDKKTIDADS